MKITKILLLSSAFTVFTTVAYSSTAATKAPASPAATTTKAATAPQAAAQKVVTSPAAATVTTTPAAKPAQVTAPIATAKPVVSTPVKIAAVPTPAKATAPAPIQTPTAAAPETPMNAAAQFSGLSLGMHGGFEHISADTKTNYILGDTPGAGTTGSITGNGGLIGLHAVLGRVYPSSFYLAGELTGSYNFVKGVERDRDYYQKRITYQLKDAYSLALRVGTLAGNALVYGKIGGTFARRTFDSQYAASPQGRIVRKATGYQPGGLIGFGVDVPVNKKTAFGLESTYTRFKNEKITHTNAAIYDVKASSYDLKLKLSFKI